jgi:hypothetical protein
LRIFKQCTLVLAGTVGVSCLGATAQSARAALLVQDTFDGYATNSSIDDQGMGTGWGGNWAVGTSHSPSVSTAILTNPSLDGSNGNALSLDLHGNGTDAAPSLHAVRDFDASYSSGIVWMSFYLQPDVGPGGIDLQDAYNHTAYRITSSGGNYGVAVYSNTGTTSATDTGVAYTSGVTDFVVIKADYDAATPTFTTWINPAGIPGTGGTAVAMGSKNTLSLLYVGPIYVGSKNGSASNAFDHFRLGESAEDVVAVPEPASLALLSLGGLTLRGRRRRA